MFYSDSREKIIIFLQSPPTCTVEHTVSLYLCCYKEHIKSSFKYYTTILLSSNLLFFLIDDSYRKTVTVENQSVATGANITFTVEAIGDDLQFQWQKNGEEIDNDESQFSLSQTVHSSTLRIQCVGKSDKGHYKCLVKSPVERSRRKPLNTAELQVGKVMDT